MEIKTKKKESYTQRTKNRNDGQNQCKKNVYIVGKEKITEDIDILKNHFSSPFFNTRMFCKKKRKEKARSFVEKYSNRLEDYGHCANSQITPGLPVEN